MTSIPRAEITEKQVESFGQTVTRYEVVDHLGSWGMFPTYAAAADRLATRRKVEKAMRTRRANKAKAAR